jgi:hypothetical protein
VVDVVVGAPSVVDVEVKAPRVVEVTVVSNTQSGIVSGPRFRFLGQEHLAHMVALMAIQLGNLAEWATAADTFVAFGPLGSLSVATTQLDARYKQ